MQNFIENDITSKVKILEYLYSKEMIWVSTKELMQETNLTQTTVLKYLSELEDYIKYFENGEILFNKEKVNGYRIIFLQSDYFFDLRLKILSDSLTLKIWNELFFNNHLNSLEFTFDQYCSLATLKRKIKKIKEIGSNYGFRIISKKNNYQLQGIEKSIRFFSYELYWQLYGGVHWPFLNIDENKVLNLINKISDLVEYPVPTIVKDRISFNYAIALIRYYHKKPIILGNHADWKKLKAINIKLSSFLPLNIFQFLEEKTFLPEDEIHYNMGRLQTDVVFYNMLGNTKLAIDIHKELETEIYKASSLFLKKLFSRMNVDEDTFPKQLIEHIYISTIALHYKAFLFQEIPEYKTTIDDFLLVYTNLNIMIKEIYSELTTELGYQLFKRENLLLNQYMFIFSEIFPLNTMESELLIYFDEPMDVTREEVAKQVLSNYFGLQFKVKIYGSTELFKINRKETDFIISSNYTKKLSNTYANIPVLNLKNGIFSISEQEISLCKEVLTILSKYSKHDILRYDTLKKLRNVHLKISK